MCLTDSCNTTIEVVAKTGKCLACGDNTYPDPSDATNQLCISDTCTSDETLKLNGRCVLKSQLFAQDKPKSNSIRTSLKLDGDISEMQSDEAQASFKTNLAGAMGIDETYVDIQSVYEGSIVVVYDLVADENTDVTALA